MAQGRGSRDTTVTLPRGNSAILAPTRFFVLDQDSSFSKFVEKSLRKIIPFYSVNELESVKVAAESINRRPTSGFEGGLKMKKAIAKTLSAIVVAAGLALPSVASAAPFINYTPGDTSGTFGDTAPIATVGPAGKFADDFTFTTLKPFLATVTVQSDMLHPFIDNVNFVSNGVKLNTTVIPVVTSGVNELRVLTNFRIPAGVQNIFVRGSAQPEGFFTGNFTLSGVPEPSTWAMMIFGFGMTGGALRRRKALSRLAAA